MSYDMTWVVEGDGSVVTAHSRHGDFRIVKQPGYWSVYTPSGAQIDAGPNYSKAQRIVEAIIAFLVAESHGE